MKKTILKTNKRQSRHNRIRAKILGTSERPRLSVFKSNRYLRVQLIDDSKEVTLASSSSQKMKGTTPSEKSKNVGLDIAQKAKAKKIDAVVFDRGGYTYTGNIKLVAEGAREGGLRF